MEAARVALFHQGLNKTPGYVIYRGMKMSSCLPLTFAGLAALVIAGCVIREPVYTAPPPVAVVNATPAPTPVPAPVPVPAPGSVPEPAAGTSVAATQPPPVVPQVEVAPPQPGPDYVWTAGYWNWNGVAWVWAPGLWVLPPYRGAVWLGGHWGYRGGRAYWVRGRWR